MTSSLFQEALADAKQLKEVAEQNAKNAIIDAVTPKIRKFIEDQLLEGSSRRAEQELENLAEEEEIDLATQGNEEVDDTGSASQLEERVSLIRAMSRIAESLTPEESATLIPVVEKMREASLKPGSAGITRAVPSDVRSAHIVKENTAMQNKNKMYEVDLEELMSDEMPSEMHGGKHHDMDEEMDLDVDEGMHGMHHDMDEEMDIDEAAEDEMADLYESLSALYEADDEPIEPTGEDEEGEDEEEDEGAEAGGMPDTETSDEELGEIKAELDEMKEMLQQILAGIQGGAGGMGAEPPPAGAEMPETPPASSTPPGAAPSPSERVYRVDESALMRELSALREGKRSKKKMPKEDMPKDEGMEDEGMDEAETHEYEDSLGEMVDAEGMHAYEGRGLKAGKMPAHTKGHGPGKAAPYSEAAKMKVMKENRDLKVSLEKHAEAVNSLRGQLTEMNLFNAKLLYVNRLLQNRDLSDAQRRNIIESLDRAQSLREVKLLYKGLSESIGRKTATKSPEMVNESVGSRTVGSSSRPLSSSGVRLNEAVEVHRWALLAGIGSKS